MNSEEIRKILKHLVKIGRAPPNFLLISLYRLSGLIFTPALIMGDGNCLDDTQGSVA